MADFWFDHIHLKSPDPAKTVEFYEKTFKAKKLIRKFGNKETVVGVNLSGITILIDRKAQGDAEKPSLDHFGICTNNLTQNAAEFKAKWVVFTKDNIEVRPDFKVSFLSAPDGVSIELQQGSL